MKFKFLENDLNYDGSQLHSLFGYLGNGILGDSIIAFKGACQIPFENMVDGEDVLAQSSIQGQSMLHFIIEEFGMSLELAVTRQRLFAALVLGELTKYSPRAELRREGDDIYRHDSKLSISIATVSPVSALIHFAMNITNDGTPVKTVSLIDIGVEPREIAGLIAQRYIHEIKTIKEACTKVKWVR